MIKSHEASLEDVETIYEILKICGLDLLQNEGIDNWWPPYPREKIIEDIQNKDKEVYLVTYDRHTAGTYMILSTPPSYYDSSIWGENTKAIYAAKLAILPEFRKLGIGRWCIQQRENIAIERHIDYVRLDIYEKNEYIIKLYKSLGYEIRGIAKTRRFNVICLEKKIIQ